MNLLGAVTKGWLVSSAILAATCLAGRLPLFLAPAATSRWRATSLRCSASRGRLWSRPLRGRGARSRRLKAWGWTALHRRRTLGRRGRSWALGCPALAPEILISLALTFDS